MNSVVNLSDRHRCIFIHVPKTAGTSIKEALHMPGSGHPPWQYYYRLHHEKWKAYRKFTVVRNPWDRAASAYYYAKLETSYWHNPTAGMHPDYALLKNKTFEECLHILKTERELLKHESWHPQSLWIAGTESLSNQLMVDYVLTYENLKNDFNQLCNILDVRPQNLPHSNQSNREPYKSIYNIKSVKLIYEIYSEDINRFNYSFDA